MPKRLDQICHPCPQRQRPCAGKCLCTIDGRDIKDHVLEARCPIGKFDGITFDKPAPPLPPAPDFGPGTELHAMLQTMGINPDGSCNCLARMRQMNEWEVAGCIEHRQEIIEWMIVGWLDWGWKEKIVAASLAIKTGLAFKFKPLDPFPGLVDEAIRRAKLKGLI